MSSTKAELRDQIRLALKGMSPAEKASASIQIVVRLEQQPLWREAKSILFFAPIAEEPDIWRLADDALKAGKTVTLPRYDREQKGYVACHIRDIDRDLQSGQFGIREPGETCARISLNQLDLILVPGIAFDLNGHRLGRGKGFYDRMLAVLKGPTCGVAFDQQIVTGIPVEPHDIRLSCILTPTRWQEVTGSRAVLK
ncbi:MAG: 5-formyltetrahydrofolate cyclo-ligase [Pedosphaera sp.]|nr:5-formyltetrahydrofolate cyclo-ligase [Pedosphaera sp.]